MILTLTMWSITLRFSTDFHWAIFHLFRGSDEGHYHIKAAITLFSIDCLSEIVPPLTEFTMVG